MRRFSVSIMLVAALALGGFMPQNTPSTSNELQAAFDAAAQKDWTQALIHAGNSSNKTALKLITWQYILDGNSQATFDEIKNFLIANSDWPEQKRLHLRAEMSLRYSNIPGQEVIDWFAGAEPVTGVGKIALAQALAQTPNPPLEKVSYLVREAWKNGDFDEAQEEMILSTYADILQPNDDIARIDRLLWDDKVTTAKRDLPRVPEEYRRLFAARMDLIQNKRTAPLAVLLVTKKLKSDPGLLYDRIRYRIGRGDDDGARDLLIAAPMHVPYPERWWRYREAEIRTSLGEGNFALAQKLFANHSQVTGTELAEAIWLQGWTELQFLHQPHQAYNIFAQMYDSVNFALSKIRAAYWAGRAAEAMGDADSAARWYGIAAQNPLTFYGQLASYKINGPGVLKLPASPVIEHSAQEQFDASELAQATKLCVEMRENSTATLFIDHMVDDAPTNEQALLAAGLGDRLGAPFLSVQGAKRALQRGLIMVSAGYPTPPTPQDTSLERALILSIVRQESGFNPEAQSGSGALGLMQLLPTTAKETAHKAGIDYSRDQLFDPAYNMKLGSHYLEHLVGIYDGSYILSTAAYNAGIGRVHEWSQIYGMPASDGAIENKIDWIEEIPFHETRSYVERVLENVAIYRLSVEPEKIQTTPFNQN